MELLPFLAPLSDRDVIAAVGRLARHERTATADLVAALGELDARRLYLGEGFPSLFVYCTDHLHFSKHEAYHRIEAARAGRAFPLIVDWLRDASLSLTAVSLLRPHLTADNHRALLEAARHQPTRAVEELVARVSPKPDTKTLVRRLPGPRAANDMAGASGGTSESGGPDRGLAVANESEVGPAASAPSAAPGVVRSAVTADAAADAARLDTAALDTARPAEAPDAALHRATCVAHPLSVPPPRPAVVRPIAPGRYHLQMTISAETHAKLRRAQDLLRHAVPTADPAVVVDHALTVLLKHLERTRCAATRREPKATKKQTNAKGGAKRAAGRNPVGTPNAAAVTDAANRSSRYIHAAVKRAVWARDQGQCAFVGAAGRCPARGFLELHHKDPFARGGPATAVNLELRCRAHNRLEADRAFGGHFMAERISGGRRNKQVECARTPTRCAPSLYDLERSP